MVVGRGYPTLPLRRQNRFFFHIGRIPFVYHVSVCCGVIILCFNSLPFHLQYPSIPIYPAHFTIGHGGKCDLKLTETSPGSLICKLKHVKVHFPCVSLHIPYYFCLYYEFLTLNDDLLYQRGAALEIYMNKVVHVNGKALDKTAKVIITGGDEVIFVSLGRHAYVSFPTTSCASLRSISLVPLIFLMVYTNIHLDTKFLNVLADI